MRYSLEFLPSAMREWKKLDGSIRAMLQSKLVERLENPTVPHDKLSGSSNRYKIKLRSVGYRLVYEVIEERVVVIVVAVGKRENDAIYIAASKR